MTAETGRLARLSRRGKELFPVRVWLHFLDRNGLLLAAGISYQALFAVFAAVYVGFSIAWIALAGRPDTLAALVTLVNTYVPGLIGEIVDEQVFFEFPAIEVGFGIVGALALVGLIWTAIGWITYSRMGVRAVFELPKDTRNYAYLKARDLLAALVLGALLVLAAALSVVSTAALSRVFELLGLDTASIGFTVLIQFGGLAGVFAIDTVVLVAMFRFLSSAAVPWRRLWGGSLIGGAGLLGLQVLGSSLLGGVNRNPLFATFAVFIGLLLWFRLTSIVTLVGAAWVAVGAADRSVSLRAVTADELEREQREAERRALVLAARVRVRDAEVAMDEAPWFSRRLARRRLRELEAELAALEAAAD